MSERLLLEYLKEVLLVELHVDRRFLAHLRRVAGEEIIDGPHKVDAATNKQALRIGDAWIDGVEDEMGQLMRHNHKAMVKRFVLRRWPGLLIRFRGNVGASEQTMYNILDTKFNSLRVKVD